MISTHIFVIMVNLRFIQGRIIILLKNPIKKSWDQNSIEKIMEGKIEYGMNHEQVRASIGNPDIINNTSSRHGESAMGLWKKYI